MTSRKVDLKVGETYFSTFYADKDLLHPIFETLVYLGPKEIDEDGVTVPGHLFQNAASFHNDGDWREMSGEERDSFQEPPVTTFEAEHMDPIVDADGLIELLAIWRSRLA